MRHVFLLAAIVAASVTTTAVAVAAAGEFGSWSAAVRLETNGTADPSLNSPALDGCPNVSRDGRTLFLASRRPTSTSDLVGDLNIWVATRTSDDQPWGPAVLVPAPISIDTTAVGTTPVNDFCPTVARDGHDFYFVSDRSTPDAAGATPCGGEDIYATRLRDDGAWEPPLNLGCNVNTAANEASPFPLPQSHTGPVLYFSSTSTGSGDIYVAEWRAGAFGPRELVPGVNTSAVEIQPSVRRDGLEIFFASNRSGSFGDGTTTDIWSATRASTAGAWDAPVNLGAAVNSSANESRPSISWDATTLYFGSTRPGGDGSSDLYVSSRERLNGR